MTSSMPSTPLPPKLTRQRSMLLIDSVKKLVPPGDEKPLKQALYTAGAIILLGIFGGVAVSTYFVLQVFIKPLLWAVLCGSFLFPFKYALNKILQSWLSESLASNHILMVDIVILPFSLFLQLSDWVGNLVVSRWKLIAAAATILFPTHALYQFGYFQSLISKMVNTVLLVWQLFEWSSFMFEKYNLVIGTGLLVCFITVLVGQLKLPRLACSLLWVCLIQFLIANSGSCKIPLVLLIFGLGTLGLISGSRQKPEKEEEKETETAEESVESEQSEGTSSNDLHGNGVKMPSDTYFNILLIMFLVVMVWMNIWIIFLLTIPLAFWICKKIVLHGKTSEMVNVLSHRLFHSSREGIKERVYKYCDSNKAMLCPDLLTKVYTVMKRGDRQIHLCILSYLPIFTSILIILFIFFASIFFTMFMAVKVQQESVLAVQLASNVLNDTVANHPEYQAWLPDNDTMQKTMDSLVNKVYLEGREWISHKLHNSASTGSNVSSAEKQALRLWDQIYHQWFPKSKTQPRRLPRQSSMKVISSEKGLFRGMVDFLSASEVIGWLQENVSSLMQIGESVLFIIQSNVGLIMSGFTTVFTAILSGGTIVLNLLVSFVIFFTTLFYLLASSKDQYVPIERVGSVIKPILLGTQFETAMQESVNAVFGASIKMFCFYGLFTWVNHCMFGSNLVYIPTILAAIFGVIPLLTTYWVCIPSALEVWLLQGSPARAIGLCIFQFAPTLFVDAAIYRDISKSSGGAHPYITGLAVAGGLYSYGLEGAITGPLILCFLLVAVNLYTNAAASSLPRASKKLL